MVFSPYEQAHAQAPNQSRAQVRDAGNYYFQYQDKKITVPMRTINGIRVNDICSRKLPQRCDALNAYEALSKVHAIKATTDGNNAGAYCSLWGATLMVLTQNSTQRKTEFCVFKDRSMIDAWKFYADHKEKVDEKKEEIGHDRS